MIAAVAQSRALSPETLRFAGGQFGRRTNCAGSRGTSRRSPSGALGADSVAAACRPARRKRIGYRDGSHGDKGRPSVDEHVRAWLRLNVVELPDVHQERGVEYGIVDHHAGRLVWGALCEIELLGQQQLNRLAEKSASALRLARWPLAQEWRIR